MSSYFSSMFKDCFKEGQENRAIIEDIEPDVFKEMLRVAYGGKNVFKKKVENKEHHNHIKDILVAADKYQLRETF